jgi:hypothetical protein
MARVSIFLLIVALVAGTLSCVGGNGNGDGSYTLIVDFTAGGTVTVDDVPLPGKAVLTYDSGAVVSLVADPSAGYRFVNWTGNASTVDDVDAASTSITMNDNYSITANFMAQNTLVINSTEGGEVTNPGEGMFKYDTGTVVDLVAEPEKGYKFLSWTGDIETVANVTAASTTITMEGDCAVTANFLPEHIYLDKIGPGLWGVGVHGKGVSTTVTEEGVVVDIASNASDDPEALPEPSFGAGGSCTYRLKGDFDVRMAYELVTWPQGSGVRVGMSVGVPDIPNMSINVERVGWGDPEWPSISFREVYLVNAVFEHSIVGITSTDDLLGTLRIRREGVVVGCYCWTSESWYRLYETEWATEDVYVWVGTWSHDALFGGEEVSVLMRTVEIVEPST